MKVIFALLMVVVALTCTPAAARTTWKSPEDLRPEQVSECKETPGAKCIMHTKLRIPRRGQAYEITALMDAWEELELEDKEGKSLVKIESTNCTKYRVRLNVRPKVEENFEDALEVFPEDCSVSADLVQVPSRGLERNEDGSPNTGNKDRRLQNTCGVSPCSGSVVGYLKVILNSGSESGTETRIRVRHYGITLYPTQSTLSRSISGTSITYTATQTVACTNSIRYNIIGYTGTPSTTPYIEVWQHGGPIGSWKTMNMDVLAECAKPNYVQNVYTIAQGAEPVEYDAYSNWNGVMRSRDADGRTSQKLMDFNCLGTQAQYSEDRCTYSTRPSYVSSTYDDTMCNDVGTTYTYDSNGNQIRRMLKGRELQFNGPAFVLGCISAIGQNVLSSRIGDIVGNGPLGGQGQSEAIVSAIAGFVILGYSAATVAADVLPEGILGDLVCGAAFNIISTWWSVSIAPGLKEAAMMENYFDSEALCN